MSYHENVNKPISEVTHFFYQKYQKQHHHFLQELIALLRVQPKNEADLEYISKSLSHLEFFSYYSQNKYSPLLKTSIQNMEYVYQQQNSYLFKQGDIAEMFYILIDGVAQKEITTYKMVNEKQTHADKRIRKINKNQQNDEEKVTSVVKEFAKGDSIGETYLQQHKETRKYSVCCVSDCHFVGLSKQMYFTLFNLAEKKRLRKTLEEFKNIPFLSHWSFSEIKRVYNLLEIKTFGINSFVFQQDDPPEYFYIIKSGEFMYQKCLKKEEVLTEKREQGLHYQKIKQINSKSKKQTNVLLLSRMQSIGDKEILQNNDGMNFSLICTTSIGQLYRLKKKDFINLILADPQSEQKISLKVGCQIEEIKRILENINQNYNKFKDFIFNDETIDENYSQQDQYKSLAVSSCKWNTSAEKIDIDKEQISSQKHQGKQKLGSGGLSTFQDYFKRNLFNSDSNFFETPRDINQKKVEGRQNLIMAPQKQKLSKHESRSQLSMNLDDSHISSHQSMIDHLNEQDSLLIENHLNNEKQSSKVIQKILYPQFQSTLKRIDLKRYSSTLNNRQLLNEQNDRKTSLHQLHNAHAHAQNQQGARNSIFSQMSQIHSSDLRDSIFSSMGIEKEERYQSNVSSITPTGEEKKNQQFGYQILNDVKRGVDSQEHLKSQQLNNSAILDKEDKKQTLFQGNLIQEINKNQQINSIKQIQQNQQISFQNPHNQQLKKQLLAHFQQQQQQNYQKQPQQTQEQQPQQSQQYLAQQIDKQQQKPLDKMKRAQSAKQLTLPQKTRITQVEKNLHQRFRFKFFQRIKDSERNPDEVKEHVYEEVIQKMPFRKTPSLKSRPYKIMNKSSEFIDIAKHIKQDIQYQKFQSIQELNNFNYYPISVRSPIVQDPLTNTGLSHSPNKDIISIPKQSQSVTNLHNNRKIKPRPISMYNIRKHITEEQKDHVPAFVDRLHTTKEFKTQQSQSINAQLKHHTTYCYSNTLSTNVSQCYQDLRTLYGNEKTIEDIMKTKVTPPSQQSGHNQVTGDYTFKYFLPTNQRNQVNNTTYKFNTPTESKRSSINNLNSSIHEIDSLYIGTTKSTRAFEFKPCVNDDILNKTSCKSSNNTSVHQLSYQSIIKNIQQNSVKQQLQQKAEMKQITQPSNISKILSQQMIQNYAKKLDSHTLQKNQQMTKNTSQNRIALKQIISS